jgi:hypothetical protein
LVRFRFGFCFVFGLVLNLKWIFFFSSFSSSVLSVLVSIWILDLDLDLDLDFFFFFFLFDFDFVFGLKFQPNSRLVSRRVRQNLGRSERLTPDEMRRALAHERDLHQAHHSHANAPLAPSTAHSQSQNLAHNHNSYRHFHGRQPQANPTSAQSNASPTTANSNASSSANNATSSSSSHSQQQQQPTGGAKAVPSGAGNPRTFLSRSPSIGQQSRGAARGAVTLSGRVVAGGTHKTNFPRPHTHGSVPNPMTTQQPPNGHPNHPNATGHHPQSHVQGQPVRSANVSGGGPIPSSSSPTTVPQQHAQRQPVNQNQPQPKPLAHAQPTTQQQQQQNNNPNSSKPIPPPHNNPSAIPLTKSTDQLQESGVALIRPQQQQQQLGNGGQPSVGMGRPAMMPQQRPNTILKPLPSTQALRDSAQRQVSASVVLCCF